LESVNALKRTTCLASSAFCEAWHTDRTPEPRRPEHGRAIPELGLVMASQEPNIHFTTWVDMTQQDSQALVREGDYSLKWNVDLCRDSWSTTMILNNFMGADG